MKLINKKTVGKERKIKTIGRRKKRPYRDLKEKNIYLRKEKLFQQNLLTNINCVSFNAV